MKKNEKELGLFLSKKMNQGPPVGECPSLVMLSEFIDGHLQGEERESVADHLTACADCYSLFSETISFQDEPLGQRIFAQSRRFARLVPVWIQTRVLIILSLATARNSLLALPALATAIFIMIWAAKSQGPPSLSQMLSSLSQQTDLAKLNNSFELGATSGVLLGMDNYGLSFEQKAIKLGLLVSRLEITLRAKDRTRTVELLHEIIVLARNVEDGVAIANSYHQILAGLKSGDLPETLSRQAAELEYLFEKKEAEFFFKLGQWIFSGQMAAIARNRSFFNIDIIDYFRNSASQKPVYKDFPRDLDTIQQLSETDLDEAQFVDLRECFNEMLRAFLHLQVQPVKS